MCAWDGRSVVQGSWDEELLNVVFCFVVFILCGSHVRVINIWCLLFCMTVPLLSQGTQSILEEESHIKDVLSRIVVEMIKREWPQHWPDMLKELDTLSKQGV